MGVCKSLMGKNMFEGKLARKGGRKGARERQSVEIMRLSRVAADYQTRDYHNGIVRVKNYFKWFVCCEIAA